MLTLKRRAKIANKKPTFITLGARKRRIKPKLV